MNKVISPVNIKERQSLDIRSGDTVRVTQKIVEKDKKTGKPKTRFQDFEGLCLAVKHGKEAGGTITLRKTASGVGVERIFPIYSPMIEKMEITKRSKVRQAKLYHIREKAAKEIRRQMRNTQALPDVEVIDTEQTEEGEIKEEVAEEKNEIKEEVVAEENTEETK